MSRFMKKPFLITAVIATAAVSVCIALMAYAFPRSIDFGDEGHSLYLLAHPAAPMFIMDHFVWGHVLAAFDLTVIGARWLNLCLLLASNTFLCVSCFLSLSRDGIFEKDRAGVLILMHSLSTFGALLFFSVAAATLNYTSTLVVSSNIFAGCIFLAKHSSGGPRVLLEVVMGLMVGLSFMARVPDAIFFVMYFCLFAWWFYQRSLREFAVSFSIVTVAAVCIMMVAICLGYRLAEQFFLLRALSQASHRLIDLVNAYVPTTAAILVASTIAAVSYWTIERRWFKVPGTGLGPILLVVLPVVVAGALSYMAMAGYFSLALPQSNPLYANQVLSSLAPGIHAGTIGLLLIMSGPLLSARLSFLRKFITPSYDGVTATILQYAVFLYFLCLMPQIGTDSGILNRCVGLGAIFLALALLLADAYRKSHVAAWMMPVIVLIASLPVMGDLYAKLVAHSRVNGSALDQTVVLDRPKILRGLKVTPSIADFQRDLEAVLRGMGYDKDRDVIMPATRQLGVIVLIDANALGNGGVLRGYEKIEIWNCALVTLGLRKDPERIFAFDYELLDDASKTCLAGYDAGLPVSIGGVMSVRLLSKRR